MSGRQSHQMKLALAAYKKGERDVYRLAAKFGLSPSSIYRALKKGKK